MTHERIALWACIGFVIAALAVIILTSCTPRGIYYGPGLDSHYVH